MNGRLLFSVLSLSLLAGLAGCGSAPEAAPAPAPEASPAVAPSSADPAEPDSSAPGEASSEAKLPRIEPLNAEKLAALLERGRGKTVVINLWATWCPPCVAEMPHFVKFSSELDPQKVVFLSISADDVATMETKVKDFLVEHKIPFVVRVINDDLEKITAALGAELSGALPATIVLDSEGKVAQLWERQVTLEDLQRAAGARALAPEPPTQSTPAAPGPATDTAPAAPAEGTAPIAEPTHSDSPQPSAAQ